jgi:hypothetical protein
MVSDINISEKILALVTWLKGSGGGLGGSGFLGRNNHLTLIVSLSILP